jgi:hypothetical protein
MNKPEWFELAEKDGGKTHFEVKRGFRSLALLIPLMAIGIGVVVAQTSNEAPASAETTSVAAPLASTSTPNISTSKIAQPAVATPPTGGVDEDEFDENENENEGDDD